MDLRGVDTTTRTSGMLVSVLRPFMAPMASGVLGQSLGRVEARSVVDETFAEHDEVGPTLPREPSVGGGLMVHLAALTIGLYRALRRRGIEEDEALALTARVTRSAYLRMAALPTLVSRYGGGSASRRLRRATDLFRWFPFSRPAYDMVDVAAEEGVVAFDVRRCPVAEVFAEAGLAQLCVVSWCNLDFELAERWGARLERSGTLAGGATCCDFRWHVAAPATEET